MTQQRRRPDLMTVDTELLVNKENKKYFKMAAYSMGVGLACVILLPLLSSIAGDEAKADSLSSIFFVIGIVLILHSVVIGFSFIFLRQNIKLVLFLTNWIILPMVAIWAVMEGMDILSG